MNFEQLSDEELVLIIKHKQGKKKEKAFSCLYDKYAQDLLNYFYLRFFGDNEKSQDFVQELFLKIIENPPQLNKQKKLRYWLFHVASNMCKNEYRKISTERKHIHQLHYEAKTKSHEKEDIILWKNLRTLNYKQQELIILRYKYNLSIKEIANIIEIPDGTVKSRLFTCIQDLSKIVNST